VGTGPSTLILLEIELKILLATAGALLLTTVYSAAARAQAATQLSPTDVKVVLEERAKFKGDSELEKTFLANGIDIEKGTVRVTNTDRARLAEEMEKLTADSDNNPMKAYWQFCGTHPTVAIDIGVVKDQPSFEAIPDDQVIGGLRSACANAGAASKAFVQKIKVIHFILAPTQPPNESYSYEFNEKTGELVVGTRVYNIMNVDENTYNWGESQ
jgi:hypothetical protein